MAIGGAFLGGGVEVVPAGSCKLELEILTEDRANLTATFTIRGTSTYTVTAGADGRAVYTVPSGQTYTVSVNTTGYDNIASQTVVAESGTVRYVRFEAFLGRVKRSGDTMTGNLTISRNVPNIYLKNTNVDSSATRTAYLNIAEQSFIDKNNVQMGRIRFDRDVTYTRYYLQLYENVGGETKNARFDFLMSTDGSSGLYLPSSPVFNENSKKVATTEWVNGASSVVHTSNDEIINGKKTFTSGIYHHGNNPVIHQNSTLLNKGTKPSGTNMSGIRYGDADGNILGGFRYVIRPNGNGEVYSEILNFDGSATAMLRAIATADGETYATAPTTPSNATSNEIATADWSLGKFVKKSGDVMNGNLTVHKWNPTFYTKGSNIVIGETGNDYEMLQYSMLDSKDNAVGFVRGTLKVDLISRTTLSAINKSSGGNAIYSSITAIAEPSGVTYATAPSWSVGTNDNSDKILTIKMANGLPSLVRTDANQNVGGDKHFLKFICQKNMAITSRAFIPSDYTREHGFYNLTADGNVVGYLVTQIRTDGTRGTRIGGFGVGGHHNFIGIDIKSNGDAVGFAPTTPTNANSNEIATAGWVNKKNKVTAVTSYTQLIELIKNGKRGDSFGLTMDYTGSSLGGITASGVETHAFGHYTIEELTVTDGNLSSFQAFGSGIL